MGDLWIQGGNDLHGEVRIQGSKNAALPMMAAAFLSSGISCLRNCPKIADIFCMEKILRETGARTWWEQGDLYIDSSDIKGHAISTRCSGAMRSSLFLLGPLLIRTGAAVLGIPGGCCIGSRPFDLHVDLLRHMGAEIEITDSTIRAVGSRISGTEYTFYKPSVGATEQGVLTGVCAEGTTILHSCAKEPEIVWLCRFLTEMGADIQGAGTECIEIHGKNGLGCADMEVPPDRIVAGTYLCAGAAARGTIVLDRAPVEEMESLLKVYEKMGGQYKQSSGKLIANSALLENPVPFLSTELYPGFPTDLQSPLMAVLATVPGTHCICETIFEDRFQVVEELRKMGAEIEVHGREATIHGKANLKGCSLHAKELRGGAALVIAALAAEGISVVHGYSYIRRGYENICQDLSLLGGKIQENSG